MDQLIAELQKDYPALSFMQGNFPCWSPDDNKVYYILDELAGPPSLLHELSHALLKHTAYTSDVDLLKKEVAAWGKASILATRYGLSLDNDHIQDCLDTYRDWLHKRSACPACHINGFQASIQSYSCLNCGHTWYVSSSRLCRPYRLSKTVTI